ncbi:hypothetical protein TSOC_002524, partial [Tetrabaena socialis]
VADQAKHHGSSSVSHASHAGGFGVGLLLAASILPDFKARRAAKVEQLLVSLGSEAHLPPASSPPGRQLYSFWQRRPYLRYALHSLAAAALLLTLLAAPLHLYLRSFKRMTCPA